MRRFGQCLLAIDDFEIIAHRGDGLADSSSSDSRVRDGVLISHLFGSCGLP
jgi:hypothetical protein